MARNNTEIPLAFGECEAESDDGNDPDFVAAKSSRIQPGPQTTTGPSVQISQDSLLPFMSQPQYESSLTKRQKLHPFVLSDQQSNYGIEEIAQITEERQVAQLKLKSSR